MKCVALISGGKDSIYSTNYIINKGYEIVGFIHITPKPNENNDIILDSYMYQTVGSEMIKLYEELTDIPVYIFESKCYALNQEYEYNKTKDDEVEDLYHALKTVSEHLEFNYVISGAILSNYQKNRVEHVCNRLNKISLAPIWNENQEKIFFKIKETLSAIIVKTASPDLGKECIGMNLVDLDNYISSKNPKYFNKCGEGGEYETLTIDAPFFKKRIEIIDFNVNIHPEDLGKQENTFYISNIKYRILKK